MIIPITKVINKGTETIEVPGKGSLSPGSNLLFDGYNLPTTIAVFGGSLNNLVFQNVSISDQQYETTTAEALDSNGSIALTGKTTVISLTDSNLTFTIGAPFFDGQRKTIIITGPGREDYYATIESDYFVSDDTQSPGGQSIILQDGLFSSVTLEAIDGMWFIIQSVGATGSAGFDGYTFSVTGDPPMILASADNGLVIEIGSSISEPIISSVTPSITPEGYRATVYWTGGEDGYVEVWRRSIDVPGPWVLLDSLPNDDYQYFDGEHIIGTLEYRLRSAVGNSRSRYTDASQIVVVQPNLKPIPTFSPPGPSSSPYIGTLSWEPIDVAGSYLVQASLDDNFNNVGLERDTNGAANLAITIDFTGTFFFRVRINQDYNDEEFMGEWSDTIMLVVTE